MEAPLNVVSKTSFKNSNQMMEERVSVVKFHSAVSSAAVCKVQYNVIKTLSGLSAEIEFICK